MKTRTLTVITVIAVIAAVVFALFASSDRFDLRQVEKRLFETIEESRKTHEADAAANKALLNHAAELAAQRDTARQAADALAEQNVTLKQQREHDAALIASLREQMMTGPINDVLLVTRDILKTDEVTLASDFARFSLSAFRTNGSTLVDWRDMKFRLVPSLTASLATEEQRSAALTSALSASEAESKTKDAVIANKERDAKADKRVISAYEVQKHEQKKVTLKQKAVIAVLSFALGFFAGK